MMYHTSPGNPSRGVNIVIDTCVLTNPASFRLWAKSEAEALNRVLRHLTNPRRDLLVDVWMVPGCLEEFEHFADSNHIDDKLLARLHIREPLRDQISVPGGVLHDLASEFRKRGDAALKHASAVVRDAYKEEPQSRKRGAPEPVKPFIHRLREGSRHHLREGFLDSGPDVDCVLLAKELRARLVTADLGMIKWARRMGVEVLDYKLLKSI